MNMKKYARILSAMTLLCGLSVAAKAELRDDVVVTVPFDFVVGHKTLPAGNYKVTSLSQSKSTLRITNSDNGSSAIALPFAGASVNVDMPRLTFERIGERQFLSTIQTGQNVYDIRVSHSVMMEAAAKSHDNMPVSGDSGGN
jgi:hypothetical protein